MSSAVLTRVGARLPASAPSALLRMPKRFAGAEYAGMKVKKNNWVEVSVLRKRMSRVAGVAAHARGRMRGTAEGHAAAQLVVRFVSSVL